MPLNNLWKRLLFLSCQNAIILSNYSRIALEKSFGMLLDPRGVVIYQAVFLSIGKNQDCMQFMGQ